MENFHKMREFNTMITKLHTMLQSLGQQSNSNLVIKLDEFQKLRLAFTSAADAYESFNNQIKSMPDRVVRAKLMFSILQNKKIMQQSLSQMTKLSLKLKQKISKQKTYVTPSKKKPLWQSQEELNISDKIQSPAKQTQQKNPLQKQLEYKTLVIYNLQKVFYQLVKAQRKQVISTRKDLVKNKFSGLEELKKQAEKKKLLGQFQNEELTKEQLFQEQQLLEVIKRLDNHIEQKMDPILQGIEKMRQHVIGTNGISNSITNVHRLILVNLEMTQKNINKLETAQKMAEKISAYARKPSCICNVVLCLLLALVAFLLLKLFGAFGEGNIVPK